MQKTKEMAEVNMAQAAVFAVKWGGISLCILLIMIVSITLLKVFVSNFMQFYFHGKLFRIKTSSRGKLEKSGKNQKWRRQIIKYLFL
jgi:hypothetical protein